MIDRMSRMAIKSRRDISKDEVSINAQFLERGGFVSKLAAGIYSYLPLGLKVLNKIESIVREEMNSVGGEEVLMPALTPKAPWEATGRWNDPGKEVMFQLKDNSDRDFGLGWSHEEIVTPLIAQFVHSYKDIPKSIYQIQTKFRDEPRAKSGLLRGREFRMKDMYSFHLIKDDLEEYYEQVSSAYMRVFERVGLKAFRVHASGGAFSKFSDEFMVESSVGEDTVYKCNSCNFAENKEIANVKEGDLCPCDGSTCEVSREESRDSSEVKEEHEKKCNGKIQALSTIEVGNIFKLGDRYSSAINWTVVDKDGSHKPVIMGCYGIGTSRLIGTVVEISHDEKGIIWPSSIAPYDVHVVNLQKNSSHEADDAAIALERAGFSILYDDRHDVSVGAKLTEADLIGLPIRVVVSDRTQAKNCLELKSRTESEPIMVESSELISAVLKGLGNE